MKSLFFVVLLGLTCGLASAANAATATRCDACSASSAMEGVALQQGHGERYVYSMSNAVIRQFQVMRECPGFDPRASGGSELSGGCPTGWQYHAFELAVEPDVQGFFDAMVQAWHAYGQSFHAFEQADYESLVAGSTPRYSHIETWPDDVNAYDAVHNSSVRNSIIDTYNSVLDQQGNPHTISSLLRGNVTFQTKVLNFSVSNEASFRVQIRFRDGSSIVLRMVNPGAVEYAPGTAMDANGAVIPDYSHNPNLGGNPGPLTGSHMPTDIGRWVHAAELNGIPVRGADGSGGQIVCGSVNGGAWECRRI